MFTKKCRENLLEERQCLAKPLNFEEPQEDSLNSRKWEKSFELRKSREKPLNLRSGEKITTNKKMAVNSVDDNGKIMGGKLKTM